MYAYIGKSYKKKQYKTNIKKSNIKKNIYKNQSKEGREKLLSIFQKAIKFDYQFSAILYSLFSDL